MFTVDSLLDMAARAEAQYRARVGNASDAYRIMEHAMLAAEYLERNGIKETPYVGPFGQVTIKKGDRVRIKAGARITSTSARLRRTLARAYTVTVYDVHQGYIHSHRDDGVSNPIICWVGTNGYWCYTEVANVEKVG